MKSTKCEDILSNKTLPIDCVTIDRMWYYQTASIFEKQGHLEVKWQKSKHLNGGQACCSAERGGVFTLENELL